MAQFLLLTRCSKYKHLPIKRQIQEDFRNNQQCHRPQVSERQRSHWNHCIFYEDNRLWSSLAFLKLWVVSPIFGGSLACQNKRSCGEKWNMTWKLLSGHAGAWFTSLVMLHCFLVPKSGLWVATHSVRTEAQSSGLDTILLWRDVRSILTDFKKCHVYFSQEISSQRSHKTEESYNASAVREGTKTTNKATRTLKCEFSISAPLTQNVACNPLMTEMVSKHAQKTGKHS